jgi:hypothetical protein
MGLLQVALLIVRCVFLPRARRHVDGRLREVELAAVGGKAGATGDAGGAQLTASSAGGGGDVEAAGAAGPSSGALADCLEVDRKGKWRGRWGLMLRAWTDPLGLQEQGGGNAGSSGFFSCSEV